MKRRFLMVSLLVCLGLVATSLPAWCQGEDAQSQNAGIQIMDAVVCQGVQNHQPVGANDVFPNGTTKIYCYNRVVGAAADTKITHNWYYKGNLKASVPLSVRSNNWRTWSSKNLDPSWSGEWMVEILSEDGSPLASIVFVVQ